MNMFSVQSLKMFTADKMAGGLYAPDTPKYGLPRPHGSARLAYISDIPAAIKFT